MKYSFGIIGILFSVCLGQLSMGDAPALQQDAKGIFTARGYTGIPPGGNIGADFNLGYLPLRYVGIKCGFDINRFGGDIKPAVFSTLPIGSNLEASAFYQDYFGSTDTGHVAGVGVGCLIPKWNFILQVAAVTARRHQTKQAGSVGGYVVSSSYDSGGHIVLNLGKYIENSKGYFIVGITHQGIHIGMSSVFWKRKT